jgi:hypothetical protein
MRWQPSPRPSEQNDSRTWRVAYLSDDETNRAFIERLAGSYRVDADCRPLLHEADFADIAASGCDAILLDIDHAPLGSRERILDVLTSTIPAAPTAVHGYGLTDAQADALTRAGIRIHRGPGQGLLLTVLRLSFAARTETVLEVRP